MNGMWSDLEEDIANEFASLIGWWDRKDKECHLRVVSEANARLSGRPLGRPAGTGKNDVRVQALALLSAGVTQREVAKRLGINRSTLVRWRRVS